jgi:Amt family ammonium transporter
VPAAAEASPAAAPAPVPNKGDNAWVMICAALVILMSIPGLALFYGGLVRSKNMLSVLMQVFTVFSLITVLWVVYGYSAAFTEGNAFFGTLDKLFLKGITPESVGATFSKGVVISELIFVIFQGAFAAITCGLIVGAFAERAKFSAMLVFMSSGSRCPTSRWPHGLVLGGSGCLHRRRCGRGCRQDRWLPVPEGRARLRRRYRGAYQRRHRRSGRCLHGRQAQRSGQCVHGSALADLHMIGASLLWFGWFGFNAGSALEASGGAALAMVNTWVATACAALSWMFAEWILKGKPSMLGAASGAVAGLVAITPAAGFVGVMGAIVIGLLAGVVCLWGVNGLKKLLGADDSLDVFGVHGVGGILGAILTGVFADPALGGTGVYDYVANAVGADDDRSGDQPAVVSVPSSVVAFLRRLQAGRYRSVCVCRKKSVKVSTSPRTAKAPTTTKQRIRSPFRAPSGALFLGMGAGTGSTRPGQSPCRIRGGLAEDDGLVAMHQHPVFQVVAQAAGEHGLLDVLAVAHHVFRRVGVVDADDVLLDDRAGVEFAGDVVAGGADQLDAARVGLVVRLGAGEAGQEAVVDVDDLPDRHRTVPATESACSGPAPWCRRARRRKCAGSRRRRLLVVRRDRHMVEGMPCHSTKPGRCRGWR